MRRRWSFLLVGIVAVFGLAAAACTASESDDDAGGEDAPADGADDGERTASATGITADTVKIAVIWADFTNLVDLGFAVDLGDTVEQIQALVDGVNAAGGVGGRMIEVTFHAQDPLEATSIDRTCLEATQDEEAFAVIATNGVGTDTNACVATDNETLYLSTQGARTTDFETSEERLFVFNFTESQLAELLVEYLDGEGELEGRTIGIVTGDGPTGQEVTDTLDPALESAGYEVADSQTLLCNDTETICEGYPVAVSAMADAGVDAVFSSLGALAYPGFVSEGANQGFRPQYYSFAAGSTADVVAKDMAVEGTDGAYEGALGIVVAPGNNNLANRGDEPEPEPNVGCNDILEEQAGYRLEYRDDGNGAHANNCVVFQVLIAAIAAAGTNPTTASVSLAIQEESGEFLLNGGAAASFAAGKFVAPNQYVTMEWTTECENTQGYGGCWVVISDFIEAG